MCIVRTPKLSAADQQKPREPTIISNPHLDGFSSSRSLRTGRSSLRIERAGRGPTAVGNTSGPPASPALRPSAAAPLMLAPASPVRGGGGAGGFMNPILNLQ